MSLLDIGEGPLCHVVEFLDVESLSRASSSCRTLRRWTRPEWERLDRAILDIENSQAEDARTRVIRLFQAQRFAIQDEEKHFPNGASSYTMPVFDERDRRLVEHSAAYEYFLRITNWQHPSRQRILIWQGFVPLLAAAEVATALSIEHDERLERAIEEGRRIYLNLHEIFPQLHWPSFSMLLQMMYSAARPDDLNLLREIEVHHAFENIYFTVVAISKTSEATNIPVLCTSLMSYGVFHEAMGFEMSTPYLPGRLSDSILCTNIQQRVDLRSARPQLEILFIERRLLSEYDEQIYLHDRWGFDETDVDIFEDIDSLDEDDAIDGGDEDDFDEGEEVDEDVMD